MRRLINYLLALVTAISYKLGINVSLPLTGRWIAFSTKLVIRPGGKLVLGQSAMIREYSRIIVGPGSTLSIGARTTIERGGEITAVSGAAVTIGSDTYVGNHCNIRSDGKIEIGENCYLAQFVSIIDGGYRFKNKSDAITRQNYEAKSVHIGRNAWIGVGAIILPGVTIGEGTVVGAGAVVTKSLPDFCIAEGNPARILSHRT